MRRHLRGRYKEHACSGSALSLDTTHYTRHYRMVNKLELHRIMQGKDEDAFLYNHKHDALWNYW